MNYLDHQLLKDLDRLSQRVNSEVGIPMLLACENLLPSGAAQQAQTGTLVPFNDDFVSALRRDADQLQRTRQDTPLSEIARIVERLAEKEFGAPGSGGNS